MFTGVSQSYWGPFMYTFALACPIFGFLLNKMKMRLFNLYVIALAIIAASMLDQWLNSLIWFGLLSLPGYPTLANNFPELFKPALSAVAIAVPLFILPGVFSFLHRKVGDSQLYHDSICDFQGLKLTKSTNGHGSYACEMFICMNKETGDKEVIPEESRFNPFLVVGPSGTGKTSLIFEPMVARDIEKKAFFRKVGKEMGFTALKTGIATLNGPYNNDYLNSNFSLGMLVPVEGKESLFNAYMKKMSLGSNGSSQVYRDLGITSISPDYESISHMIEVADNFNMKYHIVDPNNPASIGLNPFAYDNPLKAASVFTTLLKTAYQGTTQNIEKVSVENDANEAIENICILLKLTYPIIYKDKEYLPTLEDMLKLFHNFDAVEDLCNKLKELPEVAEEYAQMLNYFKKNFYKSSPNRQNVEKSLQYAGAILEKMIRYPGTKKIICNRNNNINYEQVLANGEIVFMCTRRGDLGPAMHSAFGTFFIILMQNAVLRRPGNESNRIPHFLYIDEFPEFISKATEPIFTLYRKYKVGTTISSQTLAQLGDVNSKYKNTIVSNCINKLVFGNNSIEENQWWEKEFGNIRYWKFGNNYDTAKGEYDPKLSGIDWAWKAKFAADKVRSTGFKSCLFKYKTNKGGIQVVDGKLDFLDAKYKEPHVDKKYDFEKFTNGIVEEDEPKRKSRGWKQDSEYEYDENGDINPIAQDSSGTVLFNNDDAVVINLKKNKK